MITDAKPETPAPAFYVSGRRISLDVALTLLAVVASLVLHLLAINGRVYDYDEGVYWQSLRAMSLGHPLYSSVFSSQPPFFLLSVYPLYAIFGQTLVAGRLAMVIYSLIGIGAAYWAGRLLAGRWAGCLAAAIIALDPLYVKEAVTLQAEMPMLAFQLIGIALCAAALKRTGRQRIWLLAGSGVAVGLSTMVKLFGISTAVPIVLWLAVPLFVVLADRDQRRSWAAIAPALRKIAPDLGIFLGAALGTCVLVLLPFVGSFGPMYDQVITFHVAAAKASHYTQAFNREYIWENLAQYPAFWAAMIGIAIIAWKRLWLAVPLIAWLLVELVMLLQQQPIQSHHVALAVAPLALLGGIAMPRLMREVAGAARFATLRGLPKLYYALLFLAVASAALGLIRSVQDETWATRPPRSEQLEMAVALASVTIPGDVIVTDDQYVAALADRDVPPELVDTSQVRIQSKYLTATQLESIIQRDDIRVILFASGRFEMLHGFQAWVQANYKAVATFDNGHVLYMKVPKTPTTA